MPPTTPSPAVLPVALVGQVRALADRFEAGLRAGSPPAVAELLAEAAEPARAELLRQLVRLEAEYRQQRGQPLTASEAQQRFAGLGPWAPAVLAGLGLEESATFLTLEVIAGPHVGRVFQLAGHSTCLAGRGPSGVQLALEGDGGLSRVHFLVEYNPPVARLADMRSKNGTFVNGRRVDQVDLRDGDEVRVGNTTFRVKLPPGDHTVTVTPDGLSHMTTTAPTAPPPVVIPGLEVLHEIGRGGMGVVYKARLLAEDRLVAVKVVAPFGGPQAAVFGRFQREVAILGRLTHPNIVAFHSAGEAGGSLYFVMELVDGPSAAAVVKQQGPMAAERVVTLGCQLLEALGHAHRHGFVHRDVKPGNVMLAREGGREVVKLGDFGLSRAYQASALSGLTVVGTAGGTPGFMPPEQVLDFRGARPAADQYAAAATLYFLLTGQPIYEPAPTTTELMVRILNSEPLPLRDAGPALPGRVGEVLRRALARDPQARYADVLAMREALAGAV